MNFVTYQYAEYKEAGIYNTINKKIIPFSFFSKQSGLDFPETLSDFIPMCTNELYSTMKEIIRSNPDKGINLDQVTLLSPIPHPKRNIICLGKNYADHAKEIQNITTKDEIPKYPIYFSKLSSSVTGPDSKILTHPSATRKIDYEVELAVVIGKKGIYIDKEKAEEYIFGYTIGNDITARDVQNNRSQWMMGKSLDTFCPLGPWIVHKSELPLPLNLDLRCRINNTIKQSSNTGNMIFDIPSIIADLSKGITLEPGDIILTGTPGGVGFAQNPPLFLKSGDVVECYIDRIGTLRNTLE
jgi:2-keto-4-pentenoate hydratase/2-oxohepta-3-ene-1,7-dioic acid hydratase in catechol pathway